MSAAFGLSNRACRPGRQIRARPPAPGACGAPQWAESKIESGHLRFIKVSGRDCGHCAIAPDGGDGVKRSCPNLSRVPVLAASWLARAGPSIGPRLSGRPARAPVSSPYTAGSRSCIRRQAPPCRCAGICPSPQPAKRSTNLSIGSKIARVGFCNHLSDLFSLPSLVQP